MGSICYWICIRETRVVWSVVSYLQPGAHSSSFYKRHMWVGGELSPETCLPSWNESCSIYCHGHGFHWALQTDIATCLQPSWVLERDLDMCCCRLTEHLKNLRISFSLVPSCASWSTRERVMLQERSIDLICCPLHVCSSYKLQSLQTY